MKTPTIVASGAAAPVLVGGSGLVAALVAASIAVLSASVVEVATTRI